MRRPPSSSALAALLVLSSSLALLYACQESTPTMTETDVTSAVIVRTLTITGSGTGDGTVKSTPAGINCTITGGVEAGSGCKASFARNTSVSLTATPKTGSAFRGWFNACSGTGGC